MPKVSTPKGKKEEVKVASTPVTKKQPIPSSPPPASVSKKVVRNVSLQAWFVPVEAGYKHLTPGESVEITASVIDQRLLNLQARRLVTIS